MNADGGLENIRWIRGLGDEMLRTASYALVQKGCIFLPSERDRDFLLSVFYTPVDKCFCIRRLAGARHVSPAVL